MDNEGPYKRKLSQRKPFRIAALFVIVLLAIAGGIIVFLRINNNVNNNSAADPDIQSEEISGAGGADSPITTKREASETSIQEAYDLIKRDSEDPTTEAAQYLDQQIATTNDPALKLDYSVAKANIYTEYQFPQKAIDFLSSIDPNSLDDKHKFKLYRSLAAAYMQLDDATNARTYQDRAIALSAKVSEGVK